MATLQSCSTISTVRDMSSTVELHTTEKNDKEGNTESDGTPLKQLATTDLEALLHVVKSSLGSGVLAMPVAFKNAGLLLGLIGTILVGIICTHGTHLLVHSSQKMCYALKKTSLGYAETVEAVFNTTPHVRLKCHASLARKVVNMFLFFTYFGATTTYVVIVASTLQEVTKDQLAIDWNVRWFMVISLIPLLIVGTIRSMKYLVPFSMMANLLLFIGIVITFYYILQDIPPISSRPLFVQLTKFPMFFSIVLCGLEGIGTILPIENSMKKPHHFLGCPGVLLFAMPIVVALFASIGFFGYLKYGDSVHGSITLSLPQNFVAEAIKILVGLAVLFTYGLQMTAVMEVVWNLVKDKVKKENHILSYYITRSLLVLGTVLCAIAVPQLAPALSLLGAIGFSFLGLFVPAVVDLIVISENGFTLLNLTTLKDFFLIVLSVFALVTGSYVGMLDIISEYS